MESLPREHHTCLHQLLVVLAHLGEKLLVGQDAGFGILAGFDQDHESHRHISK